MLGRSEGVRAVLGIAVLLSMLVLTARPVQAGYPGTNGRLVFSSNRGLGSGINLFTSALDGSDVVQLTFGEAVDAEAVWSPGGQRIAFTRYSDYTFQDGDIFVIDADGSNLTRMTSDPHDDYHPTWSPDAANIAFASNRTGNYDIYVMDEHGAGLRRVTSDATFEGDPAWSPQLLTRMLIITTKRPFGTGSAAIAEIDTGSGQVVAWRTNPGSTTFDAVPDWKPTAGGMTWMRVECNQEVCLEPNVWQSNFAGSIGPIAGAANPDVVDEYPSWAPDSGSIYFDTNSADPDKGDANAIFDIWSVNPGGGATAVTHNTSSVSGDPDVQPIPSFSLVDARFSSFESQIMWIFDQGITGGCNAERYCPSGPVTRGQMAAFLDRALDLPDATADYFTDDNGSTFEDSINRVREAGIAFGCTATTYCPSAKVTRGQMAAFLDRALDLPDPTADYFTDDNGSTFEDAINRVREANIAFGCTTDMYCPNTPVTRGQMAAFLFRALAP